MLRIAFWSLAVGALRHVMCAHRGRLLASEIDWAPDEERPVTVTAPGVLDATVWQQRESMTVHLVNLTNPMMMSGPYREAIPLAAQQVRLRLPEGRKARRVQLLVSGQRAWFSEV